MSLKQPRRSQVAPTRAGYDPTARRLIVRTSQKVRFVELAEIESIEAQGNYALLHIGSASLLVRNTIRSFETTLPAGSFIRIHRSTIVNIAHIVELDASVAAPILTLASGRKLRCSRSHAKALYKLVNV